MQTYYLNWSLTSPVTLDTHAAVEPSLYANLSEIVLYKYSAHCFPWILEVNAVIEEKRACPFSSSTPRRKKTTKLFCKEWASKLAESDKPSYYNLEKWLKDDKASEKPIETTAEFHEFLSEWRELFRPRSGQVSDEVGRGPAPYKNRTKEFFESLL